MNRVSWPLGSVSTASGGVSPSRDLQTPQSSQQDNRSVWNSDCWNLPGWLVTAIAMQKQPDLFHGNDNRGKIQKVFVIPGFNPRITKVRE